MTDQLTFGGLPEPEPVPGKTAVATEVRDPDDFDLVAQELFGVPASMRWIQVETLGDGKSPRALTSFRIKLAEPPTVTYKSGPRAGRLNWKKRDKSADREVVLTFAQLDAFIAKRKGAR